jgi:hypothetical protein
MGWDAELFMLVKPENLKVASSLLEVGEEDFHSVDGVQQLKTTCSRR